MTDMISDSNLRRVPPPPSMRVPIERGSAAEREFCEGIGMSDDDWDKLRAEPEIQKETGDGLEFREFLQVTALVGYISERIYAQNPEMYLKLREVLLHARDMGKLDGEQYAKVSHD